MEPNRVIMIQAFVRQQGELEGIAGEVGKGTL